MKLAVLNIKGEETGREVTLDKNIFGIEPNEHAVYLDVKQFLAAQRQGTHKVKERNEIVGSTKKLKKQKGTGTARAGSIKSPVFRGGGTIFGPKPRDYDFKLNKKVKRLAAKSVLSTRAKDKKITILEDFSIEAPKTKDFVSILSKVQSEGKKALIVLGAYNKNIYLSSRNFPNAKVAVADELNTYDLMNAEQIILAESSVDVIQKRLN